MSTADNLLIKKIITTAAAKKVSDIHLTVGNYPFFRIAGKLEAASETEILRPEALESFVDYFLTNEQKDQLQKNKEITTDYYNEETTLRFRINIFFQKGYPMISLRSIPAVIPDFDSLNLPKVIADFIKNRRGLIIISGPFSSGRSTTIASLIQLINMDRGEHIVTLEKPIEYLFINEKSIIDQREIGKDVESFEIGLKTILDEDVNVVAVGEVDAASNFEAILQLAESGRLVILSLNSDSAISVLERIISAFNEEKKTWALSVLSDILIGVVVQRLLPKINGGLVVACEVLTMTSAVKSLLIEGKFYQLTSVLQTSRGEGMVNLDKSLIDLVKKGQIKKEDAIREAFDKDSMQNILKNLV